ncbi:MAG: hypothetical protein JXN64_12285 [Spirochaetes bacterium]|nr:hypothetical protein [Spirochaetota bacterium]
MNKYKMIIIVFLLSAFVVNLEAHANLHKADSYDFNGQIICLNDADDEIQPDVYQEPAQEEEDGTAADNIDQPEDIQQEEMLQSDEILPDDMPDESETN